MGTETRQCQKMKSAGNLYCIHIFRSFLWFFWAWVLGTNPPVSVTVPRGSAHCCMGLTQADVDQALDRLRHKPQYADGLDDVGLTGNDFPQAQGWPGLAGKHHPPPASVVGKMACIWECNTNKA